MCVMKQYENTVSVSAEWVVMVTLLWAMLE